MMLLQKNDFYNHSTMHQREPLVHGDSTNIGPRTHTHTNSSGTQNALGFVRLETRKPPHAQGY